MAAWDDPAGRRELEAELHRVREDVEAVAREIEALLWPGMQRRRLWANRLHRAGE